MKKIADEVVECDVLVAGGGYAGCWAAMRAGQLAPRVTLVDKGIVARSGTTLFCHDMLAPTSQGDMDIWLKEVVEHAEYMSDQEFAEVLLKENNDRVRELEEWGVPFEREADGKLHLSLGRGHISSRVLLYNGRQLMEIMKQQLLARGVKILERIMVTDLLTSEYGEVVGAVGIHTLTGKFVIFKARAVILATGSISAKLHLDYGDNLTGDGQAIALKVGAELCGLEFNFGPTFVIPYRGGTITGSLWNFQTQGAFLINANGERFMERHEPQRAERRSTIGLLALAMAKEIVEGRGPVYFDMRHFPPEKFQQLRRIFPVSILALEEAGLDPSRYLVPCQPMVTYIGGAGCGGIRTDIYGESNIPGLLAAGNAAQFRGCAESLSGLKISAYSVFGYRAGERAAHIANNKSPKAKSEIDGAQVGKLKKAMYAPMNRAAGVRPKEIYRRLAKKLIRPDIGITKSAKGIREMLKEARRTAEDDLPRIVAKDVHELVQANEVQKFPLLIEAVFTACLERKESRLAHYRYDYPFRDDVNWLKWIITRREGDRIKVGFEPAHIGRISLEEWRRILAPIQLSEK